MNYVLDTNTCIYWLKGRIDNFLRKVRLLELDKKSADKFGELKASLRRTGELIEDFDVLIGSITLVNDSILVTNNVEHFKRIDGLKLENWLQ